MKEPFRSIQVGEIIFLCTLVLCQLCVMGCSSPVLSPAERVRQFNDSGPITVEADVNGLTESGLHSNVYRVVPGDVLELHMPVILRVVSPDLSDLHRKVEPYLCRVSDAGTIPLPIVGIMSVAGQTLAEIEVSIAKAYFPKYVVDFPAVVCEVKEHAIQRVITVMGLVKRPDSFAYPTGVKYSLLDALALAGGTDDVADPHYATVYRRGAHGKTISATFAIDEKSLADASNVMIKPGDIVSVDITARTRANVWISRTLSINFGAYIRPEGF